VIKNVAGYDLGKLFTGSQGTLGLIATVAVRLHPRPAQTATVVARFSDPASLGALVTRLAGLPLEADCLDVAWESGAGAVLVRFSGATAIERARAWAGRIADTAVDVVEDDSSLWEHQRDRQRDPAGVVAKVAHVITGLPDVLRAADALGARHVVGRAGLGISWLALGPAAPDTSARVDELRRRVPQAAVTVLDGADAVGAPWPEADPGALAVMERIKARFDPARVFRPGAFVGGL
jgi:glycolate oxidase FAD binding subunit